MSFNIQDYMKGKKVSQTKARQEVVDELGRGVGYWLEDILKNIQKKATTKSEKKGFLGNILPNVPNFIKRGLANLVPGGQLVTLIDAITEHTSKQKDYKMMIKELEALGLNIPSKFKNTFAESQLVGSVDQATQLGVSNIQSMKEAEKLAGNIDIMLSSAPVVKSIGKQPLSELFQGGVTNIAGKIPGIAPTTAANIGVAAGSGAGIIDALTSKIKLTTPGPYIPGGGKAAFYNLPSPYEIGRTFKPTLTDMLLGEPEDITMREINVPKVNAPRRRGY